MSLPMAAIGLDSMRISIFVALVALAWGATASSGSRYDSNRRRRGAALLPSSVEMSHTASDAEP